MSSGKADWDDGADAPDPRAEGSGHGVDGTGGPDAADAPEAWDAHDERRQKDCFAPPAEACECYCLHCRRTYTSDQIWFQRIVGDPQGMEGFWMCPTPNCSGAGFTFDIFPTDPNHPANEGWHNDDEEDGDEEYDDDESDDDDNAEWNPDEPHYKAFDELADEDDDIEGEEWKYGLQPGDRPPEPDWAEQAREAWAAEQRKYDEPDERPRVLDWTDRPDRKPPPERKDGGQFDDDDIPF